MPTKNFKANKKAGRGKLKAWKKGQSSSFNPNCRKFRDEAKTQSKFGYQGKNSKLTEMAIRQHNKRDDTKVGLDLDDTTSVGGLSFISTFSNCTNMTFSGWLSRWESNSMLHKEMLAVLAAITEVIKSKDGKETDTEYFAALMTTLDIAETDEAKTAVLSLLYMILKRLPESVLKFHFSKSCVVLKDLLVKYMDSELNVLLKNLLGCLVLFLKAHSLSPWDKSTEEIFSVLLEGTVHRKPRVRKSAQQIICELLLEKNDKSPGENRHAAILTAQFCVNKLESYSTDNSTAFYALSLMKEVMGCFPQSSLKLSCETILRLMTLSNSIIVMTGLKALEGLFKQAPKPENLPAEMNIRIIKALYDYQPNVNDTDMIVSWMVVMDIAFINLYRLNPTTCVTHLPTFFKTGMAALLSERFETHNAVCTTLKNVLRSCIVPQNAEFQQLMLEDPIDNPMHKIFHLIEGGLSYQYHKSWKQVLDILATSFDVFGKYSYTVMIKCLQSLADLRDSFKFPYINQLDKTIAAAIKSIGPEVILKSIPLQITGENDKLDFPRSWLLPLLRDNVQKTELGFFIRYFLPLVSKLRNKAIEYGSENCPVKAKTYEIICSQIWGLLPAFCNEPTDLIQSWRHIARTLGTSLSEHPQLRILILTSLRTLISKNLENEDNRAELSRFSKNFLPILFNLYTTESKDKAEEGIRVAVLDAIKEFLKITDQELCQSFFLKALEKLNDSTEFYQAALLDISRIMLSYVSENEIKSLYEYCKPHLCNKNHTIQKKSYSVLNELCGSPSETCRKFVSDNFDNLKELLLTSLSSSSPPSKALRLCCLTSIVEGISNDNKEFIAAIIPEVTLCTKETAVKARTAAFTLLVKIGEILKMWQPSNTKGAIRDYLKMLLAGFAGGAHMMSATTLAIGQILYSFKSDLDSDLIHMLIENVCMLLTSKSREVVISALSFIKIMFSAVSTEDLAQHVEHLVNSISGISGNNQRALKVKAKELFTRLIRKFGFEMISKLAPEQFQKQLINIRKLEQRKKKARNAKSGDYGSRKNTEHKERSDDIDDILEDSDDDGEEDEKRRKKGPKVDGKMWIEENEDNIVDFMDPSANRKILASNPVKQIQPKSSTTRYETSSDGRLIIPDENSNVKLPQRKGILKRKRGNMETESKHQGKKVKLAVDSDNDDYDDDDNRSTKKQAPKPVLTGIHRTTGKHQKAPGAAYKSKKAGGDRKQGKFDPYAYIPLNAQVLNKRKRNKLKNQFNGIVKAAKHGAKKGARQNFRNKRK